MLRREAAVQPAVHARCSFGERFDGYDKHMEACAESADARRTQEVCRQRLPRYPGSGEGVAGYTGQAAPAYREGQWSGNALAGR